MRKQEEAIQLAVCEYLDFKYPNIIYRSDGAGLKLPIGQAKKFAKMQSCKAYPDLFIAEPRRGFNGLFIEIKATENDLFRKDGNIRQTEHIKQQYKVINNLVERGYRATFAVGSQDCMNIIDWYLGERNE